MHTYDQKANPDSSKESYIVMMKDEPILTHDIDTTQSNQERKLNRKRYVDTTQKEIPPNTLSL